MAERNTTYNSSSSSPALCLFFSLPAELRDMIYTFAWDFQTIEAATSQTSPDSILAVPKNMVHGKLPKLSHRQKGLPIWLMTCRAMLKEGMRSLSKNYIFTSCTISTIPEVKTVEKPDVLNRLFFAAIETVALDRRTPSWIQDADPAALAEDSDLPPGSDIVHWYVSRQPKEQTAVPEAFRIQDQQALHIRLWPADSIMLDILHEAGTVIKELHMHWIYDAGNLIPGDEAVVENKTLDKWVGKLGRVKIRVGGEASETFAGKMAKQLVERAARRLVVGEVGGCEQDGWHALGEVRVKWWEDDLRDNERVQDERLGFRRYVLVEKNAGGRTAHQVYTVDDWVSCSGNINAVATQSGRKVVTLM